MASSTKIQESQRKQHADIAGNIHQAVQQRLGTITEVHPNVPMVKVAYNNGTKAAGNDFLPIGHSVLDIVHRFGLLRPVLRVLVTYTGETERNAIVTIVGVEGELLGEEILQANTLQTPPYLLFQQGTDI